MEEIRSATSLRALILNGMFLWAQFLTFNLLLFVKKIVKIHYSIQITSQGDSMKSRM
jgi:hypothetical protein